jgi:hypothetical protein
MLGGELVVKTVIEAESESESDNELPVLTKRIETVVANEKIETECPAWPGLKPPELQTGERINGDNKRKLKRENKARRIEKQATQQENSYWSRHKGEFKIPVPKQGITKWVGEMCPQNLALHHPAAEKLLQYAAGGCPANTGRPWSKDEMEAAIERGPHASVKDPEAMKQPQTEVEDKVRKGQAKLVAWEDIKDDPPTELKISPIAMISHKSRQFRAILDQSFRLS